MYDFLTNELCKSAKDLAHYVEDFILFEFFTFHQLLQITIFTELGDDVETVLRAEYIFEFDDVGMVEAFEKIDFWEDGIFEILIIGEGRQVYLFDGNLLFGLSFHPFINFTIYSFSQAFWSLIGIISNHFYHDFSHLINYS